MRGGVCVSDDGWVGWIMIINGIGCLVIGSRGRGTEWCDVM